MNNEAQAYLNRLISENQERKIKSTFLRKIVTNGFAVSEVNDELILTPRVRNVNAMVRIKQTGDKWIVVEAGGAYSGFGRGKKRAYFGIYLNNWWQQAQNENG
ncbi:unnamed protein product [marine sediment metagenome]|uniref:Uncharacterized protein n=1 Tax=marine sediment metagenome TaxID=412755 RepID=X1KFE6_9ZZZZ